jgi:predicted O-methyltransferase YrrM
MIKARSTYKSLQGLRDLCKYIGGTKNMSIIEIGSFAGESSEIFAQNFKHVFCVDTWNIENADDVLKQDIFEAEKNFDKLCLKYKNIIKIKDDSIETSNKLYADKFDVVYIDAKHDYNSVINDIIAWKAHTLKFIAGHDYRKGKFDSVIKAVNDTIGKPDKIFCDFSWIKKI